MLQTSPRKLRNVLDESLVCFFSSLPPCRAYTGVFARPMRSAWTVTTYRRESQASATTTPTLISSRPTPCVGIVPSSLASSTLKPRAVNASDSLSVVKKCEWLCPCDFMASSFHVSGSTL